MDDAVGLLLLTLISAVAANQFHLSRLLLLVVAVVTYVLTIIFLVRPLLVRWVCRVMRGCGGELYSGPLTQLIILFPASAAITGSLGYSPFLAHLNLVHFNMRGHMKEALSRRQMITTAELKVIGGLPLLLEVEMGGFNVLNWAEEYQEDIRRMLEENGAVLIRGLRAPGTAQFGKILSTLFGSELLKYVYRSTPRTELRGNVYTATEYPASEAIPQHNENSYSRHWPNRIGFMCILPSETGGETPIGDSRLIYRMLPQPVRQKFEEKAVMYVRNYSTLDLPWSVVFQTEDKSGVEAYCMANELKFEWLPNDAFRTIQVNQATALHPLTGEKLWFNQAHLFHVSSLGKEISETLISSLGEENLPRNSYYGDGSAIEPEVLDLIRSAYEQTKIKFPWQKNDVLLLDNMLFTHGREPYTGARKVLVGMACPN